MGSCGHKDLGNVLYLVGHLLGVAVGLRRGSGQGGVGREGLSFAQWLLLSSKTSSWTGVGMGQTCTCHLELSVTVSCVRR